MTFSGSLVAAGKLQGWCPGRPDRLPRRAGCCNGGARGRRASPGSLWLIAAPDEPGRRCCVLTAAALGFGVLLVLPIGGADMPVVISLLNAVRRPGGGDGRVRPGEHALIIAGALVGAAGASSPS